jgi:hypothetical protein
MCAFYTIYMRATCPIHLSVRDFIAIIIFRETRNIEAYYYVLGFGNHGNL